MMVQNIVSNEKKGGKTLSIREGRRLKKISNILLDIAIAAFVFGFLLMELSVTEHTYRWITVVSFICIAIGFLISIAYGIMYVKMKKTL